MYKFSKLIRRKIVKIEIDFWKAYDEFKKRYYEKWGKNDISDLKLEFICDEEQERTVRQGYMYYGSECMDFVEALEYIDKEFGFSVEVVNREYGAELIRFELQDDKLVYRCTDRCKRVKDYKSGDFYKLNREHFDYVMSTLDLSHVEDDDEDWGDDD